jgi:hypothetical protein
MRRTALETYSNLLYANPVGTGQNNCYAYAINYYRNSGDDKLQPGDLAGIKGSIDLTNCRDLIRRALADGRAMGWDLQYVGDRDTCSKGHYKIIAVLAPNEDFHWYRFHKDVLYRVKTPRARQDLAAEFGVPVSNVIIPGDHANRADMGSLVLIRGANAWSHKQGFSADGPLLRDACGKIIKDPRVACRAYGKDLNYSVVCGAFCLQKNVQSYRSGKN